MLKDLGVPYFEKMSQIDPRLSHISCDVSQIKPVCPKNNPHLRVKSSISVTFRWMMAYVLFRTMNKYALVLALMKGILMENMGHRGTHDSRA